MTVSAQHSDDRVSTWVAAALATAATAAAGLAAHFLFGSAPPAWLANSDFANYWIASRRVLEGEAIAIFAPPAEYLAHLRGIFGADYPDRAWSYPPHYLLLIWPLGLVSFPVAMVMFVVGTGAFFVYAAKVFAGRLDGPFLVLMLAAIYLNLLTAQNGFLSGGFMLLGLAFRKDRPVLAGVFFALLTVKPQLGILVPFLLLAERQWRAILSAAAVTACLVLVSATVFGLDVWAGFLTTTYPHQRMVMDHRTGIFLSMMPSLFGAVRTMGLEGSIALKVHSISAVPAALICLFLFFRATHSLIREAALVSGTFLVSPYALAYDLTAFCAIIATVRLTRSPTHRSYRTEAILTAATLLPLLGIVAGLLRVPLFPMLLWAALIVLWRDAQLKPSRSGALTQAHPPGGP